jgi:hypothetical protein
VSAGKMLNFFCSKPCNLFPSLILKNLGVVPPLPDLYLHIFSYVIRPLCNNCFSVLGIPSLVWGLLLDDGTSASMHRFLWAWWPRLASWFPSCVASARWLEFVLNVFSRCC